MKKSGRILAVLVFGLTVNVFSLGIGFGTGFSGVENIGLGSCYHLNVSLPIEQKLLCDISWWWWDGVDGNYTFEQQYGGGLITDGWYFGNKSVVMLLSYQWYAGEKFEFYTGAGTGQFEKYDLDGGGNKSFFYHAAGVGSIMLKYKFSPTVNFYNRYLIGVEAYGLMVNPDWGMMSIGVEWTPF